MTPPARVTDDLETGCRVHVTRQAQFIIGLKKVDDFVDELIKFMVQVKADQAYVGRTGNSVEITLIWSAR